MAAIPMSILCIHTVFTVKYLFVLGSVIMLYLPCVVSKGCLRTTFRTRIIAFTYSKEFASLVWGLYQLCTSNIGKFP